MCSSMNLQDSNTSMWSMSELGQLDGVVNVVKPRPVDSQYSVSSLYTSVLFILKLRD
jgi:hypothetical protein